MNMRALTLLATMGIAAAQSASADLIAHYTFDDAGNLGANAGSATINWSSFSGVTQTAGRFGAGAGSFVAGSSSAWTNAFNGADLSSFSVSMHVKRTADGQNWDDFISLGTGNSVVHVLEQNGGQGVSHFNIGNVGGDSGQAGGTTAVTVTDGQWHHIGLTVGGGTATLYVDGIARASGAYSGSGAITAFQLASRFGDGARAITAELDDVAVYNVTLSDTEMAYLANNAAVNNPVPEPTSLALLAIGGTLLARRRR